MSVTSQKNKVLLIHDGRSVANFVERWRVEEFFLYLIAFDLTINWHLRCTLEEFSFQDRFESFFRDLFPFY